jgi:SWI/SNF chromatin-remodeling complex subunit SWI1
MDFQSPQQNGGLYDPNSFIDPSAIANPQMNGARNAYPMSSIPQKRDSNGATLSRSQTPSQQPQFGFQQAFSHTPSPTMQNQHFRPGQMPPQRMQTASPAQNPHAPQMSPMAFQQQPSPMAQGFDPNAGGQFPVQSVQLPQHLQNRQQEAQRAYAMRLQAQQQQLGNLAASNMAAQQRHQTGHAPGPAAQHPGMQPGMQPRMSIQGQMQNPQQQQQAQMQAQNFMNNVKSLMDQHRRPFNPRPQVAGRLIPLHQLYMIVLMKYKGCRSVTQNNLWPSVAQLIGINPQQFPTAPEELRHTYEQNLGIYEAAFLQSKQQQQKNVNAMQGQMGQPGQQMSPNRNSIPGQQNSAGAAQQEYLQQLQRKATMQQQQQQQRLSDVSLQQQQQQQHFEPQAQPPQTTPVQNNVTPVLVNGSSTPQADPLSQHRKSMSRPLDGTPGPGPDVAQPHISPSKPAEAAAVIPNPLEKKFFITDDGYYRPAAYVLNDSYGVLAFGKKFQGAVEKKIQVTPNVPELREMGVVDIRALTMSIRSGLHAETRLALDILAKLTYEHSLTMELGHCEDLADVLVDCAEEQLEQLANENPEVTDIIDLTLYEDVIHHCQTEVSTLQDHPQVGTREYDLDRTADRLLAITSILRNLSFLEVNHDILASPQVLQFLSNAIRLVGTRVLFLRSHVNTFDFMKDLITFFSNTSTKIQLPSRDDAYAVLHFLCAFAPSPRPTSSNLPIRFTPYNPKIHRYLPSAVDSLAKLLATNHTNQTQIKEIFATEATSDPPYDLLTRTFALAIAVVPDRTEGRLHDVAETRPKELRIFEARIAEARKPYLIQGMIAADIIATLAPGPESGVCRSWLEADDGWAVSLVKFAMSLCSTDANTPHPPPQLAQRGHRQMDTDVEGFKLIVHRALSMLKRLGDKSRGADPLVKSMQANGVTPTREDDEADDDDMEEFDFHGSTWKVKADILPKKETVLGALLMSQLDSKSLRQFCGLGYLAET